MIDLVIDASVAIKWVIEEPGTREALSLRPHRLFAPDLLVAECANILWKKTQRNELSLQEALLAARLLQRADIELAPMRAFVEPATRLAIGLDHPAYDCAYLALAESVMRSGDGRSAAVHKGSSGGISVESACLDDDHSAVMIPAVFLGGMGHAGRHSSASHRTQGRAGGDPAGGDPG